MATGTTRSIPVPESISVGYCFARPNYWRMALKKSELYSSLWQSRNESENEGDLIPNSENTIILQLKKSASQRHDTATPTL